MPADAVNNKAGPSNSASKDQKPKRSRKRMRNKKRTTEVEDSSSSSSSDSSDDEEEAPKPKPAPVEASTPSKKEDTSNKKPAADSDSDDSDDDETAGDADGKRKRKRKRNTKKKTAEDTSKTAAASTSTPASSTAKPIVLSSEEVGPDPNTDLRLSDQAKQAIQYAQVYTKDKSQWKFNKAKQNWLLRNALSVPPSDYDPALARKQSDSSVTAEGEVENAEEAEEGENFVPEDFVPVVTAYLNSVMGGARQRLIESLKEAVNAPAIVIAPFAAEGTDDAAAKDADTNEEATKQPTDGTATKSVSFGNLALETEKKDEAAEAAGLPAGTDPQAVELRRTRARQMLQHMGESS